MEGGASIARFQRVLLLVCLASLCIQTCPLLAGTPIAIIDENGRSLASLFDGLLPRAFYDPPRLQERPLRSARCMASVGQIDRLALVENVRVAAPCPPPTVCSGNCICPEYIGTFCCGVAAYNFYYNCGACQGDGNEDVYIECPNGTCCWSSYACRPGG
jgi:hypothetical protein